ncbi:MAG: NERD domain-containing protein [Candidatus Bathyarchaeota archaeon]|nr:MAG: NERD domain-containing protein [Candidatus Bathyarchaeota archaeon]
MFQSRKKANNYRNIGIFFIFVALLSFLLGLVSSSVVAYLIALLFFIASLFFFENCETWGIGAQGEEKVAEYLAFLNKSYYIINDVVLPGTKGNIDHIVLGPNGIFVIETKNHKGFITCSGDWWKQRKIGRRGTPYLGNIGSPSKQVKRKAVLLNRFIQNRFKTYLYVNGIVVFANAKARLKIISPTVSVLRPQEICDFIKYYRSKTTKNINLKELEAELKLYSRFSQ